MALSQSCLAAEQRNDQLCSGLTNQAGSICSTGDPNEGVLTVDGTQHRVVLQNLPTVVESYKTLDDANLVKVADIGQVGTCIAAHALRDRHSGCSTGTSQAGRHVHCRHQQQCVKA